MGFAGRQEDNSFASQRCGSVQCTHRGKNNKHTLPRVVPFMYANQENVKRCPKMGLLDSVTAEKNRIKTQNPMRNCETDIDSGDRPAHCAHTRSPGPRPRPGKRSLRAPAPCVPEHPGRATLTYSCIYPAAALLRRREPIDISPKQCVGYHPHSPLKQNHASPPPAENTRPRYEVSTMFILFAAASAMLLMHAACPPVYVRVGCHALSSRRFCSRIPCQLAK